MGEDEWKKYIVARKYKVATKEKIYYTNGGRSDVNLLYTFATDIRQTGKYRISLINSSEDVSQN